MRKSGTNIHPHKHSHYNIRIQSVCSRVSLYSGLKICLERKLGHASIGVESERVLIFLLWTRTWDQLVGDIRTFLFLSFVCYILLRCVREFFKIYMNRCYLGQSWRRGAKCDCKLDCLVVGSISTRGNEIFIYIYIFISSFWCRGKARCWVPPLNTQCFQNSAESGERSVLILGSLCLCPMSTYEYYVRDTAWSWFFS